MVKGPKWFQEKEILQSQETKDINIKVAEVKKRSSKMTKFFYSPSVIQAEDAIFENENHRKFTRVLRITSFAIQIRE